MDAAKADAGLTLKILRLRAEDGSLPPMPALATEGAAGFDVCAFIREPVTVAPGGLVQIPTGLVLEIPHGHAVVVFARSGLACRHGITPANGVGVIDSDYRGEVRVGLCNVSDAAYTIQPLDRIAQLVMLELPRYAVEEVERTTDTARGAGGFGSTGR